MRNFKKVLALVMALAMTMTIFAGAIAVPEKASDYDTLSAAGQEAYSVLAGLGIVAGYPDGTVGGSRIVTRAEMAKLIYVAKTGDVAGEGKFFSSATLPFTDYIDAWAVPYVAYGNLNGIIAGYPDGTFKASNPVTGVEAAKMLLVALGYDPNEDGLIGQQYYANTIRLAGLAGLLKNVGGDMSTGMTRENAMIMLKNALYANNKKNTQTLGEEGFDLLDVNAVLVANDEGSVGAYWLADSSFSVADTWQYMNYVETQEGYSRFVYKDYITTEAANAAGAYEYRVFVAAISSDFADLGSEFRVLTTQRADNYVSSEIRTVYAVLGESVDTYAAYDKTAATTEYSIGTDNWNTPVAVVDKKNMASDGTVNSGALAVDGTIFINGDAVDAYAVANISTADKYIGKTTAPVRYIDNNADGIIDHLFVAKYSLGTIGNIDADKTIIIAGDNASKTVKSTEYVLTNGEVAKGDYIVYWTTPDATFIKKLNSISASISGYDGSKYTINGVKYELGDLLTQRGHKFFEDKQYALSNTQFTFITDEDENSHFIVDVLVNTTTKYADYAIVMNLNPIDTSYAKPYIRLFCADNQYHVYSLASVNGILAYQFTNEYYYWVMIQEMLEKDTLVSYVVDGQDVHITTADYGADNIDDASDDNTLASKYDADAVVSFNNDIHMWTVNNTLADSNAATIFAKKTGEYIPPVVGDITQDWNGVYGGGWRAYSMNEFYGTNANGTGEAIWVETSYNNAKVLKAMAVTLDFVPGSVIGSNASIILADSDFTYTLENGVYTFTQKTFAPFGGEAQTITYKSKTLSVSPFVKGNAYKIVLDNDGFLLTYDRISLRRNDSGIEELIPTKQDLVTEFYVDAYGKVTMQLRDSGYVQLADDAVIYTVTDLGTTDCETYDYYKLVNNFNGIYELGGNVRISAIYNMDGKISTAFINVILPTLP